MKVCVNNVSFKSWTMYNWFILYYNSLSLLSTSSFPLFITSCMKALLPLPNTPYMVIYQATSPRWGRKVLPIIFSRRKKQQKKSSLITELRQCRVQTSRAPWSCWFREIMWGEVKCVKSVSSNRHISPLPQATYAHTHTPESTQSDREQVFCLLLHQ